jgi:hypothetical protein
MEAGFVELSRARRSLGIKSNTTDDNNCFLIRFDKILRKQHQVYPHQSRQRGPPDQIGRNVGG